MFNVNGLELFEPELKKCMARYEREYLINRLNYVNTHYSDEDLAIGLMHDTLVDDSLPCHIFNHLIIRKYGISNEPKHVLAVAIALYREGAYYRKSAIHYFIKYFNKPLSTKAIKQLYKFWQPDNDEYQSCVRYFNCELHSFLANLYEKEYDFDNAIEQVQWCIICSNLKIPSYFVRIGDILIKSDIHKAKEYYEELLKTEYCKKHPGYFVDAYNNVNEKIESGYKFKPRINKKPLELSVNQDIAIYVAKYFL